MPPMNLLIVEEPQTLSPHLTPLLKTLAVRMDVVNDGFAAKMAIAEFQHYAAIIAGRVNNQSGVFIAKQLLKENPQTAIVITSPTPLSRLDINRCTEKNFTTIIGADPWPHILNALAAIHAKRFSHSHP